MVRIFYENENARCGKCKRILFKRMAGEKIYGLEIKCHSCKEFNYSDDASFKMAAEKKYESNMR